MRPSLRPARGAAPVRRLVARVRPAPVQALLARALRLDAPQTAEIDGMHLCINPASFAAEAMLRGEYEPLTARALRAYLSPGHCFVDLGANLGYFTVMASRLVGPRGMVIAVEPQTRLQPLLLRNVQHNQCFNVRLIRAAVGADEGTRRLFLASSLNTGSSSFFRGTRYWQPSEEVPCLTLASLLNRAGLARVDLLKVDVEGAEYELLMSARDVLASGRVHALYVDVHETVLARRGQSGRALLQHLEQCGYRRNARTGAHEHRTAFGAVRP